MRGERVHLSLLINTHALFVHSDVGESCQMAGCSAQSGRSVNRQRGHSGGFRSAATRGH